MCILLFSGALKGVKIDLEDVIVLKVNVKAGNVLVLQLDANVTPMFAEIVGLGIFFLFAHFFTALTDIFWCMGLVPELNLRKRKTRQEIIF